MTPVPPRVPLSSLFESGPSRDLFKRLNDDDTDTDTDSDDDDSSHTASRTQHTGQSSTAGLASSSASASGTVQGTAAAQELGAQTKSNGGAVAGGLLGGLICLVAIVFLFWRWRRKREGPKVKLEIDSTSPLNGEPPEYAHRRSRSFPQDVEDKPPSSPTSPLTDEDEPPHFWQVHNASSSSLHAFQSDSALASTNLKSDMTDLKKPTKEKDSPSVSAVSAGYTKGALASSSSAGPSSSFSSDTIRSTARTLYSESDDFAAATQVEVADLRRRVELLKQENAQLAEDREKQSSSESPPI